MKNTSTSLRLILTTLAAFLSFCSLVSANGFPTVYWLGSNGTSWTAGDNWSSTSNGTTPASFSANNYIIFSAVGSSNSTSTNLGGDQEISSLTMDTLEDVGISGGNLTINGTTTAAITTSLGAGNLSITAPLTLTGSATTFEIENLNTTLASIASSNGVMKTGNGTLTITGNSTYSGGTAVDGGTLALGASNLLLNTGNLTVGGGSFDVGSFQQTFDNVTLSSGSIIGTGGTITAQSYEVESGLAFANLAGNASLTKSTAGTVILTGSNTYNGTTTINNGTLQLGSAGALGSGGNITFTGGVLQYGSGIAADVSSRIKNSTSTIGIDTNGNDVAFGSINATNTGGLTKLGNGTLALNGNSSYTGGTFIESGTLTGGSLGLKGNITNNTTLLLGSSESFTIEISGTGALLVNGESYINAILRGNATMTGGTTIQSGTLTIGGVNSSYQFIAGSISGNIANESKLQFDLSSGIRTYADVISGNGSLGTSYAVSGPPTGILNLTGNNTYTGGTFVSVGTVDISGGSLSSTGNVSITGGTFAIGASNQTIGKFLINGTQTTAATGSGSINATSYDLRQGTVSLGLAGTAGLNKNSTGSSGSSYANGVVHLSGDNTSTGNITVNSGILSFNTVESLYSGNNSSWTPANISVSANSTLALGTGLGGATQGFNNAQIAEIFASLTQNGPGGLSSGSSIGFNVASGNFTLNSTISDRPDGGSIGLDKIGGGVLILGVSSNFTGELNIFEGIVRAGTNNALSTNSSLIVTTKDINIPAGYDLGDFDQQFVDVTLISGTLAGGTGTINATGNYSMHSGNATANLSGAAPLLKTTNGIVYLSGNNSYTGHTTVNSSSWATPTPFSWGAPGDESGKLQFQNSASLYSGNNGTWNSGNITVNQSGIFSVRADETGAQGFTSDQIGTLITNLITTSRPSGGLLGGSAFGIDTAGTNMTLSTALTDSGITSGNQSIGLVKYGSGTLTLNGTNNTHSLITSITGGTLALAPGTTLSASNANLAVQNGVLDMGTTSQSVAGVFVRNGSILGNGTLTSTLNNATLTGFSFGNSTIDANLAGAVSASIYSPSGTLASTTLSGNNTHSGNTTVGSYVNLILANVNALSGSTLVYTNTGSSIQLNAGTGPYNLGGLSGSSSIAIGNNTLSIGANGMNTTYSGNLTDTDGSITKVGNGTLTLSGNNTYTGGTTISSGTLAVSSTGGISHAVGNFIVGNTTGDNATFTLNGGNVSNGHAYIGFGNGSTGTVNINSGNWTNANNMRLGYWGNGTLNLTGGNISNTNGMIGKYGNSTGVANVSGGTWSTSGSMIIGDNTATGTLNLTGGNVVVGGGSGNLTLAGESDATGTLNLGTGSTVGSLQVGQVIGGNGTASVNFNHTGSYSFATTLTGNLAVDKLGAGTTILSGNHTYTGGTTVSAGTISVTGSVNGTASVNVNVASALTITGSLTSNGAVNVNNGTITIGQNGSLSATPNGITLTASSYDNATLNLGTFGGNDVTVTVTTPYIAFGNGTGALNLNLAGNNTFSTTLTGGGANSTINKFGTGTTTFNSTNSTYAGAVNINSGTLKLETSLANATFSVQGGTLAGGNITVGDVTINSGGTIAPGSSPGTLSTGNMTWNGGGTYTWEMTSVNGTSGTDWDLITSAGSLTIGANSTNQFTIAASTTNASGFDPNNRYYSWKIAEFTGGISNFSSGAFNINTTGFEPGLGVYTVSANSTALSLNYATMATWNAGTGNWTTVSNWEGNFAPIDGVAVEYAGPFGTNGTSTNDDLSLANISCLTFTTGANGSFTVAGGTLEIGIGGIVNNSTFTQTVGLNITLGANQTFAANTADLNVSGNISGGYSLTKEGNQTLTFSGTNSYTGETTINAGTLAIAEGGSLNGTSKIFVGNSTSDNTLSILGSVSTGNLTLSHQVGSDNNTVTVGGGSSPASLTVSNLINVGFGGTGNSLDILGNGTVNAASTWIGGYGESNALNLAGGVLNSTTDIVVGYFAGENAFNITAGGNATVGSVTVGLDAASANNTILVSGSGSALHTAGLVYLGESGSTNSLVIENGGKVISQNADAVVGFHTGSNGNALTINGTGSQLTNNGTLYIGKGGSENSLSILNGASLVSKNSRIGHEVTSSNNTATVSGNGSKWTNAGTLRVGNLGSNNTLAISSGANVTISGNTFIGHGVGSDNNLVSVEGAGSVLNLANATVGLSGSNNTLLVADSGSINAIGIQLSGTNSTLQIGDGAAGGTITTSLGIGTGTGTGHQVVFNHTDSNLDFSPILTGNLSLSQIGTGTTTLTSNNIYTGGTTISAGTLALGGTQGSVNGTISVGSGATFSVNRTNDFTLGNLISGDGSFAQIGSNKTSITAANNYTGGTTISSGTLWTKNAQALGTGNVLLNGGKLLTTSAQEPIMGNQTLSINGSVDWNSGIIAFYDTDASPGAEDLKIHVAGNFNVSAGNKTFDFSEVAALNYGNYTLVNATTINATGVTFVAAHGPNTTLFGNFTTNNQTIIYTVTGAVSGGTDIQNYGGPNTPLVANYNVTGPTVTIGLENIVNALTFTSSAPLAIQSNGELTVTSGTLAVQNGSSVVSGGTLNTPGNFDKTGAGELDLQNTTNVSGIANVVAGLMSVNGQLNANEVVVDPNATLGGAGFIVAQNVLVNGNLSPGNSPGTLSVAGNLVLGAGSSTVIEIASPTSFDRIVVSGTATLGGTLNAVAYGGGTITPGTRYDFLQAGSIVGEFDSIVPPDGLRMRFLNSGTVGTLLFGPASFVPYALNQNQINVAKALDTFVLATKGDALTVAIALDSLTAEQFPAAFDQIMPGFYESLGDILIEQTYNQTQLLTQRLGTVRLGAVGFQAIGLSQPIKYDKDGKSASDAKTASPIVESAIDTKWNSWVIANGEFSLSRGLAGVPNYNNNSGGFLVGADYRLSKNFAAGLFAGYEYSYAKYNGGSSTQGNSALFGLYGSYTNEDGYYADAIVSGGYTGFQTRRSIQFGSIDRTASADPNSGQFSAALNLGKDFEVGKFTLGPIVGAQYTYAGIGAFTESGADSLDLALGQQNANSLRTNLGARLAYNWEVASKITLIPEIRGFWMHEFLNGPRNISSALEGGSGPSFDYETSAPYSNSVFGGAGISAKVGDRWSASVFYNVNFGAEGYTNNIISTSLGFSF